MSLISYFTIRNKEIFLSIFEKRIIYSFCFYNIIIQFLNLILFPKISFKINVIVSLPSFFIFPSIYFFKIFKNRAVVFKIINNILCLFLFLFVIISIYNNLHVPYNLKIALHFSLIPLLYYLYVKRDFICIFYPFCIIAFCFILKQDARALLVYLGLALFLISYIYFNSIDKSRSIIKWVYVLTILLFFVGVVFGLNIFSIAEDGTNYDTRTYIYQEINEHLIKNDGYLFGTPGKGYKSSLVDLNYGNDVDYEYLHDMFVYGRNGTEAGILNFVLYGGLINVLMLLLLFGWLSFKVSQRINNKFCATALALVVLHFPYMLIDGVWSDYFLSLYFCFLFSISSSPDLISLKDNEIIEIF